MKLTKLALATTIFTAAVGIFAGTSSADAVSPVGVSVHTDNGVGVIETDSGQLVSEDGVFKVKSADGTVLAGTPLKFRLDDFEFPIDAAISGNRATLTPAFDMSRAVYHPVALPFDDSATWKTPYEREKDAWSRMASTVSLGISIAAVVGAVGGGAIGCLLGGSVGALAAFGTIVGLLGPFLPAAVVGCVAGASVAAPLGTLAAQFVIAAPIAIGAAIQYFSTINAPFPAK
ncbi:MULTISPECIES: hypothetical protein [unclassified Nocardia]|uniref:hypothetical protein n=1 Tax=unclassified Nocardia TaxID=2637762 RepID=UPI001CE49F63|nr:MULTISPECIES: hypothetical protein [unclassified Nocardia]